MTSQPPNKRRRIISPHFTLPPSSSRSNQNTEFSIKHTQRSLLYHTTPSGKFYEYDNDPNIKRILVDDDYTLVRRYKRFFADVQSSSSPDTLLTAHCPNTGAMTGLKTPGSRVVLSQVSDALAKRRKLKYTWEQVQVGSCWVNVNTARTNHIIRRCLESNLLESYIGKIEKITAEQYFDTSKNSRVDFVLEQKSFDENNNNNKNFNHQKSIINNNNNYNNQNNNNDSKNTEQISKMFLEVKNVTLAQHDSNSPSPEKSTSDYQNNKNNNVNQTSIHEQNRPKNNSENCIQDDNGIALFPDTVTERGQKHLRELIKAKENGYNAATIYCIAREDCRRFSPSKESDPVYYKLFWEAKNKGVLMLPIRFRFSPQGVEFIGLADIVETPHSC